MDTGNLTPRSADVVCDARFSGDFDQPDGFSSVLKALVRTSGAICLQLTWRSPFLADRNKEEQTWAIELTNEQRKALGQLLLSYDPVLWEPINYGVQYSLPSIGQVISGGGGGVSSGAGASGGNFSTCSIGPGDPHRGEPGSPGRSDQ